MENHNAGREEQKVLTLREIQVTVTFAEQSNPNLAERVRRMLLTHYDEANSA